VLLGVAVTGAAMAIYSFLITSDRPRNDPSSLPLGPDAEKAVLRYVREVIGLSRPRLLDVSIRDETRRSVQRWQVIQCSLGPNPDYPEIDCAPSKDRNYPALSITVERIASGTNPASGPSPR
jgi:hypothetical protein